MNYILDSDLKLITEKAGKEVNDSDFTKLKVIYGKLKHICELLVPAGFIYEIRQDPRKQAGTGKFVFQNYQWAKIYPEEYFEQAQGKFAYIIGFSDTLHFHLMGIKEYQELLPSLDASGECWTEIDFQEKNYEYIVEEFVKFDKKFRSLFVNTGSRLSINYFQNIDQEIKNGEITDLLRYKKQIILQGPPGTGKTRLAKEIAQLLNPINNNSELIKEDIITSCKNEIIIPAAKSKLNFNILGVNNSGVRIQNSEGNEHTASYNEIMGMYKNRAWEKEGLIVNGTHSYSAAIAKFLYCNRSVTLSEDVGYFEIIQFHPSYAYEDFVRGIVAKPNPDGEGIIYEAENKTLAQFAERASDDPDNKYILIIDEINRANLSSVLGELIYTLEYRGEAVDSMYEVGGSNKLTLPPNLYIIGTMNTADRSVGHIDYAIRRRFAFVDILPKNLKSELKDDFREDIFEKVSKLFVRDFDLNTNYNEIEIDKSNCLSNEFDPKDVWLGHSYFIQQYEKDNKGEDDKTKPIDFNLRIQYEIKPILREYLKDGIFIADKMIDGQTIKRYIESL